MNPKLKSLFIYSFLKAFIEGATALNFVVNKMIDATIITTIGIIDMAKARLKRDGGQYFVSKNIAANYRQLPITVKEDDSATF